MSVDADGSLNSSVMFTKLLQSVKDATDIKKKLTALQDVKRAAEMVYFLGPLAALDTTDTTSERLRPLLDELCLKSDGEDTGKVALPVLPLKTISTLVLYDRQLSWFAGHTDQFLRRFCSNLAHDKQLEYDPNLGMQSETQFRSWSEKTFIPTLSAFCELYTSRGRIDYGDQRWLKAITDLSDQTKAKYNIVDMETARALDDTDPQSSTDPESRVDVNWTKVTGFDSNTLRLFAEFAEQAKSYLSSGVHYDPKSREAGPGSAMNTLFYNFFGHD